jgi:2-polyprenyl-3-methyl-5-hydroxy-6-metoxy-1,4-benzoquinol methylase
MTPTDLHTFRLEAALASGGVSSLAIKQRIRGVLDEQHAAGSLVDVGAGQGELLATLVGEARFPVLEGVDIMPRPAGLPSRIGWTVADLNEDVVLDRRFDVAICSENIEHLENPRRTFRNLRRLLVTGGLLVLTLPNQESLRSYLSLVFEGHFTAFRDDSYPAHITALLRSDLCRIARETGFGPPDISYVPFGGIPKLPQRSWQAVSAGLLGGRLFSDNLVLVARAC